VEAGAHDIVFFLSARCIAKPSDPYKKLERWNRISEEAAKQSGRGIIPRVSWAEDYGEVLNAAVHTDLPLFMYETGAREALRDVLEANKAIRSAAIITGPEGGFEAFEADLARLSGLHVCSMGERILRCETAPIVAITALMYATGNLN
jgi:16S rRNA (uracil1498-N3)-methyltransferase